VGAISGGGDERDEPENEKTPRESCGAFVRRAREDSNL
jgi:hypothetical protein